MGTWQVPKIWDGEEAFIFGGGPSILSQFNIPKELSDLVLERKEPISAYSPYFKKLHSKHIVAVNAAFKIGHWFDFTFFGDKSFFFVNQKELAKFPKPIVAGHPYFGKNHYKWIKYLRRDTNKPRGLTNNPKMISWNYNSGYAAINFVSHLGAKRIILLGFDMNLGDIQRQHFHSEYRLKSKLAHEIPFNKHMKGTQQILKDAKSKGIEIINASPNSSIKEFKKVHINEIL